MKLHVTVLAFFLVGTLASASLCGAVSNPLHPFPQHVRYAPATISPAVSRQTMDSDVRLFYDHWKSSYLVTAGTAPDGTPMYRVSFGSENPARTVSEGQGYGMLIVTFMAGYDSHAREIFDGLWAFTRQHQSTVDDRLMQWEVPGNPSSGMDAAFDGDADMAHALFLADAQWGSDDGVNYRWNGEQLLAAIKESMTGHQSHLLMLGDWVEQNGAEYNQYTPRSSDFMPAHFRSWYRLTGNSYWMLVLQATQAAIFQVQRDYSPATGLLPDFMVPHSSVNHSLKPASPNFLEGPHDGHYEYNAGRVPWRIATDALLNGSSVSFDQAGKIADWIVQASAGDVDGIHDGYFLNGLPLRSDSGFTTFFAAPFGVALMTTPAHQQFLTDIYLAVRQRHEDYYEDSVNMLCLLLMSCNYWEPAGGYSGDVDGDLDVDLTDLILSLKVLTGQNPSEVISTGDINGDHMLGLPEVLYILQESSL